MCDSGNGEEVVILCTWSGLTHFVDRRGQAVSFHSQLPVRAFTAGTNQKEGAVAEREDE